MGLGVDYGVYNKGFIPIYLSNRIKLYKSSSNNTSFSLANRIGGVIYDSKPKFYYSTGLTFLYEVFNVSLIYEGAYLKKGDLKHKIGIGFGIRFGDYRIKKVKVETLLEKNL
ncbi:hypothetical protein [Oceanivirga miroungae]|uniref:Outer membrane protein beta-barrel domain-containing protein n=1 Tax=Oceanivirga miroungae TaxID=1130046 RepID=A0A6I8MA36_9FUSO|nr:hypothetical protein [Oceanivirga miroungae]VWL85052.1 hypothetical protein OMES3154_00328 [Oceanivirga miroungae]